MAMVMETPSAGAEADEATMADLVGRMPDLSTAGRIARTSFDRAVAEAGLPARLYRPLRDRLSLAGLSVVDDEELAPLSASEGVIPLDARPAERDPGWSAVGQDVFIKRNWHELLTAEQEHDLGVAVQRGLLAQAVLDEGGVPLDATKDLIREARRGQRAADQLVRANLRLVSKLAWRFQARVGPALEMEDLFQEGVIGLGRAIEKFDPDRDLKLSTYATWWIRQHMERAIADKQRAIRLPVHKWEEARRVWKEGDRLRNLGKPSSAADIARSLGMTEGRVSDCQKLSQPVGSLDRLIGSGSAVHGDFIADPEFHDPAEVVAAQELQEALVRVLAGCSEREKKLIILRFGLHDGRHRTLEEVGVEFGVTRERIRQIEAKVLAKLRNPARREQLAAFVDFADDLDGQIQLDRRRQSDGRWETAKEG